MRPLKLAPALLALPTTIALALTLTPATAQANPTGCVIEGVKLGKYLIDKVWSNEPARYYYHVLTTKIAQGDIEGIGETAEDIDDNAQYFTQDIVDQAGETVHECRQP